MNITQYEKMKKHLSDEDTGPFTFNEFTFYMKADERYTHIPVFELKLSAQLRHSFAV